MLSGAPQVRSRNISTCRNIYPCKTSSQFAASEGQDLLQSFARSGCGLPALCAGPIRDEISCGFRMVCAVHPQDPSIPLRSTRDDSFAVTLSGASKTRSRKVPTFQNIRHCSSHGFTLIRPSRPLDYARGDRIGAARFPSDSPASFSVERTISGQCPPYRERLRHPPKSDS